MSEEWTDDVNCAARRVALAARYHKAFSLTGRVELVHKGATDNGYRLSLFIPDSIEEKGINYVHNFNLERNGLFSVESSGRDRLRIWMDELGTKVSALRLENYPNARFRYTLLEPILKDELPMRVEYWDVKREAIRKAMATRKMNRQLARQARATGQMQ